MNVAKYLRPFKPNVEDRNTDDPRWAGTDRTAGRPVGAVYELDVPLDGATHLVVTGALDGGSGACWVFPATAGSLELNRPTSWDQIGGGASHVLALNALGYAPDRTSPPDFSDEETTEDWTDEDDVVGGEGGP